MRYHTHDGVSRYAEEVDAAGTAQIPTPHLGLPAWIVATNHFPLAIDALQPGTYALEPTPGRLVSVGEFSGEPLRMSATELVTLDVFGVLRRYEIHAGGITERSAVELPVQRSARRALAGDELWLGRLGSRVIDVWSIDDPAAPHLSYRIDAFGYWFARHGALVVAIDGDRTQFWRLEDEGRPTLVSEIALRGHAYELVENRLYVQSSDWSGGGTGVRLTVVDLRDPTRPSVTYQQSFPGYGWISLQGDRAILTPAVLEPAGEIPHLVLDLTDPLQPVAAGELSARASFIRAYDERIGIGLTADPRLFALLERDERGLRVLSATTTGLWTSWPELPRPPPTGLAAHPYYAFGQHVWRLEAR